MSYCGTNFLGKITISLVFGLSLSLGACADTSSETDSLAKTVSEPSGPSFPITEHYLNGHPSEIFMQAANYLEQGQMEQATLWFYAGQLRYRVLLDCPSLNPSPQDIIVYSAQFEIMEPRVNGWAGNNLNRFVEILDRVLAWDERNLQTPENYADCVDARTKIRGTYDDIRRLALSR